MRRYMCGLRGRLLDHGVLVNLYPSRTIPLMEFVLTYESSGNSHHDWTRTIELFIKFEETEEAIKSSSAIEEHHVREGVLLLPLLERRPLTRSLP